MNILIIPDEPLGSALTLLPTLNIHSDCHTYPSPSKCSQQQRYSPAGKKICICNKLSLLWIQFLRTLIVPFFMVSILIVQTFFVEDFLFHLSLCARHISISFGIKVNYYESFDGKLTFIAFLHFKIHSSIQDV